MTKNEITIYTTDLKLKEFEDWFNDYQKQNFPDLIELNKEKSLPIMGFSSKIKTAPDNTVHSLLANFNNPSTRIPLLPFTIIEIKIAAFTDYKLNVTISLNSRNKLKVFIIFLEKIREIWPETMEAINKYIFSLVSYIEPENKFESEDSIELSSIDKLCIRWADRDNHLLPNQNMNEFLGEYFKQSDKNLSIDMFKKALKNAGKRKLIIKNEKGRWTTKKPH
jgi:hypothetical protein